MATEMRKIALLAILAAAAGTLSADIAADCKAAAAKKRAVMFYETGIEVCFWPKATPYSPANFANLRLGPLARTQANVDTIVYAPLGGFAYLTAKIPSVDTPQVQPVGSTWMKNQVNRMPEFLKAGTDPLKEACKWARTAKKEFFVSLPVNSVDNATSYDPAKPPPPFLHDNYLFAPWKLKHQASLMGGKGAKLPDDAKGTNPPHAHWSAVDYGDADVRAKYSAMCKEIAEGYDVDGILVDFMKNPWIFKSVAWGGNANAKELQQLTEMMTGIKAAVRAAAQKKSHPILLVVRVPDSLQYCKAIGIDLQAWIDQKLPDIFVFGGGFRLNPSSACGALLAKSGIPFYASLGSSGIYVGNDSGYANDDEVIPRHSRECFRAQVMEAAKGGAAGVLYEEPPHWIRFSQNAIAGSAESERLENKRYFTTYKNGSGASSCLKDGAKFRTLPYLVSSSPIELKKGSAKVDIDVWDDFAALKKTGVEPKATLTTEAFIPSGMDIEVTLNGRKVTLIRKKAGHQIYAIAPGTLKTGRNEVSVKQTGRNKRGLTAKLGNVCVDVIFKEPPPRKEAE